MLENYGLGPQCVNLLRKAWDGSGMVPKRGGGYGDRIATERGVRQGDILSPTVFNIIVDAVLHLGERYLQTQEPPVASTPLWQFYTDDGLIAGMDSLGVQAALDITVDLFERFLAPQHNRNIRQANIGLLLSDPHHNAPFHYITVDVTVSQCHSRHKEYPSTIRPTTMPSQLLPPGRTMMPLAPSTAGTVTLPPISSTAASTLCHSQWTSTLIPLVVLPTDCCLTLNTHTPSPHSHLTGLAHILENHQRGAQHTQQHSPCTRYQELPQSPSNLLAKANRTMKMIFPEANIYSLAHYAKASLAHSIVSALAIHANNQMAANRTQGTNFPDGLSRPHPFCPSHPTILTAVC